LFSLFFQDAEEADENDGTNDFFKFEKCLVKCAKEKKKQLLEKQASSVISKLNDVLSKFRQVRSNKREAIETQHNEEIACLKSGIEYFEKKKQEERDIFVEGEIERFLAEFESEDRASCKSEEEMLEKFCDKVNSKIEEVDARKIEILNDFEKWKEEKRLSSGARITWVSQEDDDDRLKLKHGNLKIHSSYKPSRDPYAYATNNYLWGTIMTAGACLVGGR